MTSTIKSANVLTAHQPMYLPWLGLLDKISRADMFCIFDDVPFERHGYGNRNQIKSAQGPQWLTVPVTMKGHQDKPGRMIEVCNDHNWRRKHLRAIELAYQKAEYFDDYFPALGELYDRDWVYLDGINRACLDFLLQAFDIEVDIVTASEQGFSGAKSDLVLDMCLKLGATDYIFGSQGADYANVESFLNAGVNVWFQDYQHPTYPQLHGGWHSHMSAIDLLMNCGPKSREILNGGTNGASGIQLPAGDDRDIGSMAAVKNR